MYTGLRVRAGPTCALLNLMIGVDYSSTALSYTRASYGAVGSTPAHMPSTWTCRAVNAKTMHQDQRICAAHAEQL